AATADSRSKSTGRSRVRVSLARAETAPVFRSTMVIIRRMGPPWRPFRRNAEEATSNGLYPFIGRCALLLHREWLEDRQPRVGGITLVAPERTQLRPLRVGNPRGAPDARNVMGRLDHLAAIRDGRLHGRVDVLDGDVRDPVRRLAAGLERRVTADHRFAGIDH